MNNFMPALHFLGNVNIRELSNKMGGNNEFSAIRRERGLPDKRTFVLFLIHCHM